MAKQNYGLSMSNEICEGIAETSFVEGNYPTSKPPVQQGGGPAYDEKDKLKQDKLRYLDDFEDSATIPPKPLIVRHNKNLSPTPPSHDSPTVWSQSSHNEISSPEPLSVGPPAVRLPLSHDEGSSQVPSAHGLPKELDPSPPPYSPPINQVKLLILKLRKI